MQVAAAGLCHSDLSVIDGNRPRPTPMSLGHEASGIVVENGAGVDGLVPGDHVVMVFVPSCGQCIPCSEGRPALCEPGAAANGEGTLLTGARRLSRQGSPDASRAGTCRATWRCTSAGACRWDRLHTDTIELDEIKTAFDRLAQGQSIRQIVTFS